MSASIGQFPRGGPHGLLDIIEEFGRGRVIVNDAAKMIAVLVEADCPCGLGLNAMFYRYGFPSNGT